jgi:predicted Zn finger-like uncharacterized protein
MEITCAAPCSLRVGQAPGPVMHVLARGCNRAVAEAASADGTNQDSWKEITQLLVFARNPIDAGPAHPQGIEIAMRLTCPNCGARYEVDDALIPPEGRDVQCSDCVTTWFQAGRRTAARRPRQQGPPSRNRSIRRRCRVVEAPEAREDEIEASAVQDREPKPRKMRSRPRNGPRDGDGKPADGDPQSRPRMTPGRAEEAPGRQDTGGRDRGANPAGAYRRAG